MSIILNIQNNLITKVNLPYLNMYELQQSFNERSAVQSLLQMQNSVEQYDQSSNWNEIQKSELKSKKSILPFNFIQPKKKSNPQIYESPNFVCKQKLINLSRLRRAKSLFDPVKIFKINSAEVTSEQNLQNSSGMMDSVQKIIIHKHPDQIKDLSFKSVHPTKSSIFKKEDSNPSDFRINSKEYMNGECVMIQVQSYQESFNKKQMEYFMNKTSGLRNFRSHMSLQKKEDPFPMSFLQMKTQAIKMNRQSIEKLEPINKYEVKLTPKMKFIAYVNRRSTKEKTFKSADHRKSVDLGNLNKNDEIAQSLRFLLQNLKDKRSDQSKERSKISYHSNSNNGNESPVDKIFDKEGIFKQFQQEEFKAQRQVRMNKKMMKHSLQKQTQFETNFRSNSPTPLRRMRRGDDNQLIKVSTPMKYYQRSIKKYIDEKELKIFNIKKLTF